MTAENKIEKEKLYYLSIYKFNIFFVKDFILRKGLLRFAFEFAKLVKNKVPP